MSTVRDRLLPRTVLGRVRLATLAFATVVPIVQAVALVDPSLSEATRVRGLLADACLVAIYLATFVRGRTTLAEALVVGPLVLAAGVTLIDPMAVLGLGVGTLVHQSLYGSNRVAAVRAVGTTAAYLLTVVLSEGAARRGLVWHSGLVLGGLPNLVGSTVVMRVLRAALGGYATTAARDALLARTATALLGQTDRTTIRRIGSEAGAQLCAMQPGVGVLLVRVADDTAVVENAEGVLEHARGATAPREIVAGVDLGGASTQRLTTATAALDALAGRRMHWCAMLLGAPGPTLVLFVAGERPLADDSLTPHRALASQITLAEQNGVAHRRLAHEASHDPLTGLPNRASLHAFLAALVDDAHHPVGAAVLQIDLDDFKVVNDTYGHVAGDALLVEVARRLRAVAGTTDSRPGRLGGDEFVLILPDATELPAAEAVAERLLAALSEPVALPEATVRVTASVGIAQATPELTAGDLVRLADIAMYTAKRRGKHRVEHFDPAQHGRVARVRMLEEHLPFAIDRGEIVVHYQPQVDLRSGRCHGVEALARWRHPRLGLVAPLEFIPLAERSGAIDELGEHVLRTACDQVARWAGLPDLGDLRLSVNVAAHQLSSDSFAAMVRDALSRSGLAPGRLTVEITESQLLEGAVAAQQLAALAEHGVRIAIDDFGTGYASLAYLRSLPVHQVKIDRSFVESAENGDPAEVDLARAVFLVGQSLGLETIAEGVEHADQADALGSAGVEIAQGFLFARPMPSDAFPTWAANAAGLAAARTS